MIPTATVAPFLGLASAQLMINEHSQDSKERGAGDSDSNQFRIRSENTQARFSINQLKAKQVSIK